MGVIDERVKVMMILEMRDDVYIFKPPYPQTVLILVWNVLPIEVNYRTGQGREH